MTKNTDWMRGSFGISSHYTTNVVNEDGSQKPFYEAIRDFDINLCKCYNLSILYI